MATVGQVIDNKYEILRLIGQGGMSKVYLAMDKRLNKTWAVKEVAKNARDKNNEIVIQSAITEANLMKKLDHPSLPRIVDIIENANLIYVVMDYVEGESLDKVLDEYGAQPQEMVLEWAKQLCEVLDYLHTSKPPIVYRDMKPANVVLQPNGNIKLLDFGIAREYKETNLADTVSLGTKGYAAPEQFGGKGQTDARTDVHCLGVTLYHLVTGQNPCEPPYELYPIRHWNKSLSGGLERIIQKCTQLNPDDRYQSCAELLYALEHHWIDDDDWRQKQKKKLTAFIISASLTVVFGLSSLLLFLFAGSAQTADYNHKISIGEYLEAIANDPSKREAYIELLKQYKREPILSEDRVRVIKALENNQDIDALLANGEYYAEVCYQIATAFWFYYETDQATQSEATKWFLRVTSVSRGDLSGARQADWDMAQVFGRIGTFYQNEVIWNKEGGAEENAYRNYWNDITELLNNYQGENEFVAIRLMNEAVRESVNRRTKLNNEGITNESIADMIKSVRTRLGTINSEELKEQRYNLLSLCNSQLQLMLSKDEFDALMRGDQ